MYNDLITTNSTNFIDNIIIYFEILTIIVLCRAVYLILLGAQAKNFDIQHFSGS